MKNYTAIHEKNRECFIYCLFNQNNVPIYVGKSVNPQNRFKAHKCYFSLKKDVESFEILDDTTIENALFLEMYWTHQFLQWGFDLENITNNFKTELRNKELRQEQAKERKISDKKFKNEAAILGLTTIEYLQYILSKE
jgi:uncharacterized protein YegJ (DUF2314 family)